MVRALPRRQLIARLRALGFSGPFVGAKHEFMVRERLRLRIPNPHGRDIPASLIRRMLREAGIPEKDWDDA
ncbi:MAG: type II toxin-antitoxin system HicA family toxin [Dehalococcoidia bacterium]|nr:type II toxin-antitoxin system HicA family toxin [Dehalococcoidia bacterium]